MITLASQSQRTVSLSTPLGEDVLLLAGMSGKEEIGRIFRYELDLLSEQPDKVKFDDLVGQNVTVSLSLSDDETRYFNGHVCNFEQMAEPGHAARYRATVVPWLWFLTRRADCRIFQNMTVPDIIKQVFRDAGFSDFEEGLTASYRTWDYCVQYRETDFNFVSRLMEQEGIYYFFKHEEGVHTLVLCDSISAHKPFSGYEKIKYLPSERSATYTEYVRSCSIGQTVQPGMYALNDYDFKAPAKALHAKSKVARQHAASENEVYDYPGEYRETGDGESYAKIRINELQSQFETVRGTADARGVSTGCTFELTECDVEDLNRELLVTSCNYQIQSDLDATGGETVFSVGFTAIDSKQSFYTPRATPKPVVQGPQTAVVVGPAGEEIYTDEYGRVKVQFHWDRDGKSDENSSCWIRVAQVWAGKKWGAMYIPRIDQEVIVEFLEGDPDQPIITGRVYNASQMPPYGLPADKTKSTIKSNSSKGGGGSNEMRFEDKKGEEEIFFHAQKDQNIVVENDETLSVGNNETVSVGNDRTETVGNNETITIGTDRTETVGSNETISIGSNRTETVGTNETITIGSARTETVGSNETVTVALTRTHSIGVNDMLNVGAAREVTVGGAQAITVGAIQSISVGANQSTDVGVNQTTNVGKNDSLKVGKKLSIDAGDEILIKTGKSSILMKKDGTITIKGKDIKIDGSGKIDVKAKKNIVMKGKKILEN